MKCENNTNVYTFITTDSNRNMIFLLSGTYTTMFWYPQPQFLKLTYLVLQSVQGTSWKADSRSDIQEMFPLL